MINFRLIAVVLALALVGVVMTGQASQTPGRRDSDPSSMPPGSVPTGQEGALASPAASVEVEEPEVASPQSYNASIRIPVAGLKPRNSNVEWQTGGQGGCTFAASGDRFTWWSTPLYLPQGSTLRYLRMYYNDQSSLENCEAYLTVYDLYGGIVVEWGISSSSTGQSYATTSELDHVVDYTAYQYVINWRPRELGNDMQVCGFRVFYETPPGAVFLPLVESSN